MRRSTLLERQKARHSGRASPILRSSMNLWEFCRACSWSESLGTREDNKWKQEEFPIPAFWPYPWWCVCIDHYMLPRFNANVPEPDLRRSAWSWSCNRYVFLPASWAISWTTHKSYLGQEGASANKAFTQHDRWRIDPANHPCLPFKSHFGRVLPSDTSILPSVVSGIPDIESRLPPYVLVSVGAGFYCSGSIRISVRLGRTRSEKLGRRLSSETLWSDYGCYQVCDQWLSSLWIEPTSHLLISLQGLRISLPKYRLLQMLSSCLTAFPGSADTLFLRICTCSRAMQTFPKHC